MGDRRESDPNPGVISRRSFVAGTLAACAATGQPTAALVAQPAATAAGEVAWLADVQKPPTALPPDAPQLAPVLVNEQGETIHAADDWRRRRAILRQAWLQLLGSWAPDRGPAPKLTVLAEEHVDEVVRQRVAYESEPGDPTEAYLLRPALPGKLRPGVVVFHSTVDHSIHQPSGVAGPPEKWFGLKMARRGYVTFCPRNYLWPTNDKIETKQTVDRFRERHPSATGMAKMLHDALVATDILAAQQDVDPKRLGAVGHSLGAKEVLYLAALDERIRVTVSSEGGIGTRFSNWDAPWYLGDILRAPTFQREHHELLALVAPRAFLLVGGNSADGDKSWPFIEAALPVYRLMTDTPRLGLFNHGKGHAVPDEAEQRIHHWFDTYL